MRKFLLILCSVLLFAGCSTQETMETVMDEPAQPVSAQPREIYVDLPEEAVMPAMESEDGLLYMCKNFDVVIQTLDGGDLQKTIQEVSGYRPEELTVVQTQDGELTRSEFVWSTAGEAGEQVCRAAILDDGNYHYVLTAMIDEENAWAYQEMWNGMFESFEVI